MRRSMTGEYRTLERTAPVDDRRYFFGAARPGAWTNSGKELEQRGHEFCRYAVRPVV